MKISEQYSPLRSHLKVYGSVSGNYAFRNTKSIWFESTLERDFLLRAEYDFSVYDIVEQPVQVPYITSLGDRSLYTPDFLMQFNGASLKNNTEDPALLLVEIKPIEKLRSDWIKLKPKFLAAQRYAKSKGWKFKIYNETRIYDLFWDNIKFIKRFRNSELNSDIEHFILATIKNKNIISIQDLEKEICSSVGANNNFILQLIAKRKIICNLSVPLTPASLVWASDHS